MLTTTNKPISGRLNSGIQATASRFVGEFLKLALSSDGTHVKLTYQDDDKTWVLLYHLVSGHIRQC